MRPGVAVMAVTSPLGISPGVCCVDEAYKFQPAENTVKMSMGSADRRLRTFVVAPVLVVAGLLIGPAGWLAIVLYVLAALMLATSAVGSCPLYTLLRLGTRSEQKVTTTSAERAVSS